MIEISPRVAAAFAADGLVTREQALDLGLSPGDVRYLCNSGSWMIVRRGVYTTAAIWEGLDEYVGRPRMRAHAAVRRTRRGWVLSHDSAAHELGLPILDPPQRLVHLTRPGYTNAWTEHGVKHHLAHYSLRQVAHVDGLPVLDLPRTAVDIAREHGLNAGVVACDAVLRRGASRADLEAAYAVMANWPHVRTVRECVALADVGAETPLESLGRLLVIEAGIGTPDTQFPVGTRRGLKWCDIRVGNHIFELHGAIKYRGVGAGGLATRAADEVIRAERVRERLIADQGLGVTRL
ncbi:MAG: type IV toxin-antitoxin system AbiEi family antitoxin domain-containing protein [Nocardioidaceae bacterium]|nr:type IV toxin-antitoxin system AbiEi family antitoxin domain-containing protein [Nocardioidaceae bacterium]